MLTTALKLTGSLGESLIVLIGHKLHSDVNGALNIMKLGVKKIVNALRKPLSFVVTANGVSPLKGSNAQDLGGTLALKAGGVGQLMTIMEGTGASTILAGKMWCDVFGG